MALFVRHLSDTQTSRWAARRREGVDAPTRTEHARKIRGGCVLLEHRDMRTLKQLARLNGEREHALETGEFPVDRGVGRAGALPMTHELADVARVDGRQPWAAVRRTLAAFRVFFTSTMTLVVTLDTDGRPSFQALQKAPRATVVFYAFDPLELNGRDLTILPIETRRGSRSGFSMTAAS